MLTVADQLRTAREAQNLTVYQIAEMTKIRTDHVQNSSETTKQTPAITTSKTISNVDSSRCVNNFTGTFATSNIGNPNLKNALKNPRSNAASGKREIWNKL